MFLPAPGGGDYAPAPEGTHAAVCVALIDLGTQPSELYAPRRMVRLSWEIAELMDDGRPFLVSREYGWSMGPKSALRRDLEAWRGKRFEDAEITRFDARKLLRVGCLVTVMHKQSGERVYANVASVSALPRGLQPPPVQGDVRYLSLQPDLYDEAAFEALPEWLRDKVRRSPEFSALRQTAPVVQRPPTVGVKPNGGHGISAPQAAVSAVYDHNFDDEIPF